MTVALCSQESGRCPQERMKIWSPLLWQIPMEKTPDVPAPIAQSAGTETENVLIIRFCWLTIKQKAFFMRSLIWKQSGNTGAGKCWATHSANRMFMGELLQNEIKEPFIRAGQNNWSFSSEAEKYNSVIGRNVTVAVDRLLGSYHPKHKDIYYPINYGYIEGIIAQDGEEQDVYILGVDKPVDRFTGRIIAVVHRNDDVEEKWVAAPENMDFTKEEIMEQVGFQEQYFDSEVVM